MSLKITLKPHERMILGTAVIKNGKNRTDLIVENNVSILREKDILSEDNADTPCKKIYFVIQLMYVDNGNIVKYHNLYWTLIKDVIKAAPSTLVIIDQISELIIANNLYNALKLARKLIEYEQEVISRAS
ncbi:MAG: flagellar biosynthesis repressor FlbT [Desulfobacterales bacterium]|nr:flagellar biosynthesis repressor FlbT [Desulfobacterales bacterium]